MAHTYLIAFAATPTAGFLDALRAACAADGVNLLAAKLAPGPGCSNLAVKVAEPDEQFAMALTLALMPSKWCDCRDELADGTFVDEINVPEPLDIRITAQGDPVLAN